MLLFRIFLLLAFYSLSRPLWERYPQQTAVGDSWAAVSRAFISECSAWSGTECTTQTAEEENVDHTENHSSGKTRRFNYILEL